MSKKKTAIRSNFSRRINLCYLVLIVILLVLFGIISYFLMRMNISENTVQTMTNTGNLISGLVNDNMSEYAEELSAVASDADLVEFISDINNSAGASSAKHFDKFSGALDRIASGNPDIVSAWIISEQNGRLIGNSGEITDPESYGLSDLKWYQDYISGKSWASSYRCTNVTESLLVPEGEKIVTLIAPVKSGDNVFCFCGIEVRAESVFSVLSRYTFNTGSYPIVSADSEIIYAPAESSFSKKISLSDFSLVNIISRGNSSYNAFDSYVSDNNETIYYYFETDSLTGWNVIVLFDSSEINGNIYTTFMQQLVVLGCLAVLMFIIGLNILRNESHRIRDIHLCTEEIAAGNLNYRIQKTGKSETGQIAENINKIAEMFQAKNAIISSFNSTDTLTGLSNRIKLYEYMEDIIRTREEGRSRFAVMFVDIDNFKWLNETLGHNFGDAVLSTFASVLKEQTQHDCSTFRFSGDEFIIIKEFDTDYSEVYNVIERIHKCFNSPLEVLNDKIYIKFSVGVSIYPEDDLTPDLLLRNAEMALHRAKESGKDRVAFYTNSHKNQNNFSKAVIARSLNEALKNGELFLHYQPIVSTKTYDIHGFEVLLRWISPEFGVVPPTEFISVAEESGAIVQIGTWIFENACRTLKKINETLNPDVIMSINVSTVQLRRDNYIEHVKRVIDITRVNPKNIQLEITESTLIDFTDSKTTVIDEINDLGIALALDDFGTGYSSLNYLKNFPIKCLKIDKSFIDEINNNKRDYAITDSIIDLVHNLGIHTVAEGIETVGQYDFLTDMNCDYIQGFLMSKPLGEADAIEFVENYNALHKPDKLRLKENEKKLADERKQRDREKKENNSSQTIFPTADYIISK